VEKIVESDPDTIPVKAVLGGVLWERECALMISDTLSQCDYSNSMKWVV
jgi:hypothetical protein